MILLPEMGASCVEGPPIWASGATTLEDEATCLVFGAILIVKSVLKMKESRKSFKLFLTLDTRLNIEEEESNHDSWKTVVFYRHSDPQKYAARVSRPILRPMCGMCLERVRVSRVKEKTSPQLCQTRGNAPRTRVSRLIKSRPSKGCVSSIK